MEKEYQHLSAYEYLAAKNCFEKSKNILPLLVLPKNNENKYIKQLVSHDQMMYI